MQYLQEGLQEDGPKQNHQGLRDGQGQGQQNLFPKQDMQGLIDILGHCHVRRRVQYLKEGVQKDAPKDPQGTIDGQRHRHFQNFQECVLENVPKQTLQGIIYVQGHNHDHVQYPQEEGVVIIQNRQKYLVTRNQKEDFQNQDHDPDPEKQKKLTMGISLHHVIKVYKDVH